MSGQFAFDRWVCERGQIAKALHTRWEAALSERFTCAICGEEHEGLVTNWAYKLPDVVWEIAEDERAEKARFNSDLCQFGERYFIRCVLDVPFTNATRSFVWGAWAEVDWSIFERYLAIYGEDGSSEPVHAGVLANDLPAYPGSLGTPVKIQFRDATNRPSLYLSEEDGSRLALEQRVGIGEARYHEILRIIERR